jgi:aminotransferase
LADAIDALGPEYYQRLAGDYRRRRDLLHSALVRAGFRCTPPEGAYYILADFRELSDLSDDVFAHWLVTERGVAAVPGSSFFSRPELGRHLVRFAFCKTDDVLEEAARRLVAG